MRFFQPVFWRRAALGLLLLSATALAGEGAQQQARTMVHLLDYIGQDYSAAVRDGEIIDASEYAEMQEFCRSLTGLAQDFLSPAIETEIQNQLAALQQLVANRDTQRNVAARARAIKTAVIAHSHLTVAPTRLPDRARGKLLYQQNCATCHGADGRGDGPSAATLDPKPTSFFDAERMASLSPFQAFNTIRLGVTGTAMAAFDQLPEEAGWDLAFYVVGLRHDETWPLPGTKPARNIAGLTLEKLASHSDRDLRPLLPGKAEDQPRLLSALRVGYSRPTGNDLGTAAAALQASLAAYQQGRFEVARTEALRGYLEGVEPVEAQLLSTKPRLARELEDAMARVRQAIDRREPVGQLEMAVTEAQEKIGRAAGMLEAGSLSPWIVFSMTVAILAREGFEAILVILAILGVTKATSARAASRWVHGGWMAALLLGAVAWLFSDWLLRWSAFQREVMEGISSLLAVTVLLSVGFLLHSKTEIGRWKRFIDVQVKGFLEGRNLWGLAFVAFIGVFREAIETVLFLSALGIQGGPAAKPIILSGVAVALAGVFILGAALLRFSARIPIRTLFSISSCLMALLAVVLTGKGLHSLQESGFLSMTAAPISFRLDLIGLYPTMETLFFQGLILLVVIALWIYARRPSPRLV